MGSANAYKKLSINCSSILFYAEAAQHEGNNNITTMVVVACTLLLAAIVVVATVLIIRARKAPTTSGNANTDVGHQLYENQNFQENPDSAVPDPTLFANSDVRTEVNTI